MAVTPALNRIG